MSRPLTKMIDGVAIRFCIWARNEAAQARRFADALRLRDVRLLSGDADARHSGMASGTEAQGALRSSSRSRFRGFDQLVRV